MTRIKIDYGIDLGTTNSAICRMEKGEPTVIKTDVLKDTMPSCISINKKGSIKAGDGAYNTMKQDKRRATKSWHKEASNTYQSWQGLLIRGTVCRGVKGTEVFRYRRVGLLCRYYRSCKIYRQPKDCYIRSSEDGRFQTMRTAARTHCSSNGIRPFG